MLLLFQGVCYTHCQPPRWTSSLSVFFLLCIRASERSAKLNSMKHLTPPTPHTTPNWPIMSVTPDLYRIKNPAACLRLLSSARRVRAAEGRHGEEEAECTGRKRLAVRDPLLHPLQSGLCASGQPQAGCESLSTAVGRFKTKSVLSHVVFSLSRRTMQTQCSWGITTWLWPPSRRWWWVSKALHSLRYYYIL